MELAYKVMFPLIIKEETSVLDPSFGESNLLYTIDKARRAAVQHLISRLSTMSEGALSSFLKLCQLRLKIVEDGFITICFLMIHFCLSTLQCCVPH